ncbi:MAG: hypothetical protein NWF00_11255 [Candidatus Bathyarchaeota archaeon]|nr:hypothetical protein [Candidatus Bathyarchaeota archaeon]
MVNESFSFMTPRPISIMELYLTPEAKVSAAVEEVRQFSGYYTFSLQEPLQPNTLYTATLFCGQSTPPNIDMAPAILLSWQFMTENASQTTEVPSQTQTSQSTATASKQTPIPATPINASFKVADGASFLNSWVYVAVAAVGVIVVVALAIIMFARKRAQQT